MYVQFYERFVADVDHGISDGSKETFDRIVIKRRDIGFGMLKSYQEFGTITVIHDVISCKEIYIDRFSAVLRGRIAVNRFSFITVPGAQNIDIVGKRIDETVGNKVEPCAAAVDHARLLEQRQEFGRMFQRFFHSGEQLSEKFVQRGAGADVVRGIFNGFTGNGKYSAFRGIEHGRVRMAHAVLKRDQQAFGVRVFGTADDVGDPFEKL